MSKGETPQFNPETAGGETQELRVENERLKQQIEDLKREVFNRRFDSITGLETEIDFYRDLDEKVAKHIQDNARVKEVLDAPDGESLPEVMRELNEIPLCLGFGDASYLSYYNGDPDIRAACGGDYAGGDDFLRKTAGVVQTIDRENMKISYKIDPKVSSYRAHGHGDEFAFVMEMKIDEAEEMTSRITEEQSKIEVSGAELPPNVDIGTASLNEAIKAFLMVFPQERRKEMGDSQKAEELGKILIKIAERRSNIIKVIRRINLVVDLVKRDPELFKKTFGYLRKNAFGLNEKEVLAIADKIEKGETSVAQIAKEQLRWQREESQAQATKEYNAITSIADSKFDL